MDILEVHNKLSFQAEVKDWWVRARFEELERQISLEDVNLLVDVGCGSGANLYLTKEKYSKIRLLGVEKNCVDVSYDWLPKDINISPELPTAASSADVILLMDILEHIQNDLEFLKNIVDKVGFGTQFFLSVPAFPQLWSQRDVELGHHRRYLLKEIIQLCTKVGLKVDYCRYRFSFLAIVLFLVKKKAKSTGLVAAGGHPSGPVALCLDLLSRLEAKIPNIPFGTSIILVASKNTEGKIN